MSESGPVYVVGIDGSEGAESAARYAAALAQKADGRVVLAHVVDWSDYTFINVLEIDDRHKMREKEEKHAREDILEPLTKKLADMGVDASYEVAFGHPAKTLAKIGDKHEAEMICAGTRGRSDVKSLILGSFSHNLLQIAQRPVLFVP